MRSYVAAALIGLASTAYGQSVSTTEGGITYSVSVPDTTASSGSGDIYIQISGPTSNSWMGFGQGSTMSGAKMFIVYANSAGTNVTLSPRKGSGHVQPSFDSSAQVTLLEGSGISNGVMTANIKCSDCKDLTSSSSNWVYASLSGSALSSDSQSASISQHSSNYGSTTLDMTKAKNSANTNPFVSTSGGAATTGGSGTSNNGCAQVAAASSGSTNSGATPTTSSGSGGFFFGGSSPTSTDDGSGRGGRGPFGFGSSTATGNAKRAASATPSACVTTPNSGSSGTTLKQTGWANPDTRTRILMSHGIIAGLAFVILFPLGAIAIRLFSFPGLVAFHAACQTLGYLFFIVGFGLGVYIANKMNYINQPHAVIGIILFILAFFQPILGALHHANYKKFQTRTTASHGHIWLGRIIITLGIINGGLGLKLADNSTYGPIVYGIFAAVAWVIYVVAIVIGERRKKANGMGSPPKYDEAMALHSRDESADNTAAPQEFYGRQK